MKMTLIDKNALIRAMRDGLTPLPDKDYDRAKNKIINDLIEVVRGYPEADISEYQRMQKECKHYKELCYSLFATISKLCEIIAMVKADFDDEND